LAEKVTVGLATHWPCITDVVVCQTTGSKASRLCRRFCVPPFTSRFILLV